MGNGILSRSGSGDGAKIGDIRLTTRDSIGAKWALCNGDSVPSGSPITDFCTFDPTNTSNWYDLTTVVTQVPNIILYDPTDNVYWGIYISNAATESASKSVQIYRYDRDERGQYQSVKFSTTIKAYCNIYDACFIHDEERGNKIAFAYVNSSSDNFIVFYDINTNTCTFSDTAANIYLTSACFNRYSYDITSTRNGNNPHSIAAAGRFVILLETNTDDYIVYDTRTNLEVTSYDIMESGITMTGYASGPRHTVILHGETTTNSTYAYVVDNNTGAISEYQVVDAVATSPGTSISCIYEENEDCEYFIFYVHEDNVYCYRGYLKITSNGTVTCENDTNTMASTLFGSNAIYFGSYYEFKMDGVYYALVMNSSNTNQCICSLSGKGGTINSKSNITLGGIYSADRNIFGYKTGAPWYLLSNGYNKDIVFTIPCLPIIGEGSYNGFIKVEN